MRRGASTDNTVSQGKTHPAINGGPPDPLRAAIPSGRAEGGRGASDPQIIPPNFPDSDRHLSIYRQSYSRPSFEEWRDGLPRKLRVLSLFAGIGGFDLGLERTGGFETVAVAELDPYASRVLALRFPDAVNVGDVTKAEYPDADIICAGFPCQDISFAGAGAGLAGARSGLFWEVVRAARVVRPRYIILENVAALLSRGLDVVLGALAEVGYDTEWHCIPASAVGAPHRRDRIWIVAHARGIEHEGGCPPLSGTLAAELSRAVADAAGTGWAEGRGAGQQDGNAAAESGEQLWAEPAGSGADGCPRSVANAPCELRHGCGIGAEQAGRNEPANGGADLADALEPGVADPQEWTGSIERQAGPCHAGIGGQLATEPDVGRVAHGVPSRVDRLKCLGNSIVPQIAEMIFSQSVFDPWRVKKLDE